jgi:hypothetical protein
MNPLTRVLILLTGGLIALNSFTADATARPLRVLHLGPVSTGGGATGTGGGFGGSRTNYIYLPGQTLAPEVGLLAG